MPQSYQSIAELVRQRIGADVALRPRFQSMVNAALSALADRIALDKHKRNLLLTDKMAVTAIIANGSVDLSSKITAAPFINLERIKAGTIYYTSSDPDNTIAYPLEWIEDQQRDLPDDLDDSFINAYLEGSKLFIKDDIEDGTLSFAVLFVPSLATLPDGLLDELINEIVIIVKSGETDDAG